LAALAHHPALWATFITLAAFGLRVWALEQVPPGWRDDELIESLVISQKILDGDLAFFYPDASGHEALYHSLNAVFLAWFGPTGLGIRLLSAFIGTLTVPLTYVFARRLFGPVTGLTAAALLAVSFWGLMYARVGIRHSLTPLVAIVAFYLFWRAMETTADRRLFARFAGAGVFLGLGFHSYFASRGAPLIPAAFLVYLMIFAPAKIKQHWRGILTMFAVTALVALPLALAITAQPEAEGRVNELALPVIEAQRGNFELIVQHVISALSMPHKGGDPEWLYNIPGRPVFGLIGAAFFWAGVGLATWRIIQPLQDRLSSRKGQFVRLTRSAQASAFVLIWWLVGITPAFLSVPPASLGHVILAQPAFYILAALPIGALAGCEKLTPRRRTIAAAIAAMALISLTGARDIKAYFVEWPQRGMVRFLYHADVEDVASFVLRPNDSHSPIDFGITGLLAGPWNRVALDLALEGNPQIKPRWYNPDRALLLRPDISFSGYPTAESPYNKFFRPLLEDDQLSGGYQLTQVVAPVTPTLDEGVSLFMEAPVCFTNHLCWTAAAYDGTDGWLEVQWQVNEELELPPMPLISNPPPPGVYAGPRLYVFAHLIDENGVFLAGDDGLWVDPLTLQPGDVFLQRHRLTAPAGSQPAAVVFGLYDPLTGERIPATDGQAMMRLELTHR
jgi:4-amino-4-deoxy-L-arabinose transferase-like glycosyltransferase